MKCIESIWSNSQLKGKYKSINSYRFEDFASGGKSAEGSGLNGVLCSLYNVPLAYWEVPTSNDVVFGREIWDDLLSAPEFVRIMRTLKSHWGEPFHRDSHEIKIPDISHRVTDFWVEPNNIVVGNMDIVDTPMGIIAYNLLKSSYIGNSQRGWGNLEDDFNGLKRVRVS